MVIICKYTKTKAAETVNAKLPARYGHSQAATLAQDALQLNLSEMRLDATWKKKCVVFLVTYKNCIIKIKDHEKRTWLWSLLLLQNEMNWAFGNLERNERLLASELPSVLGVGPSSNLPFPDMLDQAHTKVDAVVFKGILTPPWSWNASSRTWIR